MPRNRSKPTNLEALDQVDAAVARVISTVRSVLRKYPYGTLHPTLVPYVHRYPDRSTRRSTQGDEIVLGFSAHFSKADMLSFPVVLLDAPEQEITRWARDQYWSAIEGSKFKARQEARRKTQATSEALSNAGRNARFAIDSLAEGRFPGQPGQSRHRDPPHAGLGHARRPGISGLPDPGAQRDRTAGEALSGCVDPPDQPVQRLVGSTTFGTWSPYSPYRQK